MKKNESLKKLSKRLLQLIEILDKDPKCQWYNKFKSDYDKSLSLLTQQSDDREIDLLCDSIIYVFQGMGSFNDYAPLKYNSLTGTYEPLQGIESYEEIVNDIYELARTLRE